MGYYYQKNEYDHTTLFDVIEKRPETSEEIVLIKDETYANAKKITQFLRNGGGFAGWTPEFMLQPAIININTIT